jgi:hypothetical protein
MLPLSGDRGEDGVEALRRAEADWDGSKHPVIGSEGNLQGRLRRTGE